MIKNHFGFCFRLWNLVLLAVFKKTSDEDDGNPITFRKVFNFWTVVLLLLLLFVTFSFSSFECWGFVAKLLRLIVVLVSITRALLFGLIFLKERKDSRDEIKHNEVDDAILKKKVERLTLIKR